MWIPGDPWSDEVRRGLVQSAWRGQTLYVWRGAGPPVTLATENPSPGLRPGEFVQPLAASRPRNGSSALLLLLVAVVVALVLAGGA